MRAMRARRWLRTGAAASLLAGTLVAIAAAPAAATDVGDEAALRSAVANAAESSITLTAQIELTCGGGAALVRDSATPLTITGQGHAIIQQCVGPNLIDVQGTGGLTLSGVLVQGGNSTVVTDGAPVSVQGGLIIGGAVHAIDSATGPVDVSGSVVFNGGVDGIHSSGGPVTVTDSTLQSGGSGIVSSGDVSLVRSLVRFVGGDGMVVDGTTTIVNSTVSLSRGSGIVAGGPTSLVYTSVVGNGYVPSGPAFNLAFSPGGSFELQNTVVAHALGAPVDNCAAGAITSHGYNFSDDATCALDDATDQPDGGDAMLVEAAFPPGSLFTAFVPQVGSPLIDAIPAAACQSGGAAGIATDQFGNPRPGPAGGCDIGAYQTQELPSALAPAPAPAVTITPTFTG